MHLKLFICRRYRQIFYFLFFIFLNFGYIFQIVCSSNRNRHSKRQHLPHVCTRHCQHTERPFTPSSTRHQARARRQQVGTSRLIRDQFPVAAARARHLLAPSWRLLRAHGLALASPRPAGAATWQRRAPPPGRLSDARRTPFACFACVFLARAFLRDGRGPLRSTLTAVAGRAAGADAALRSLQRRVSPAGSGGLQLPPPAL